MAVVLSSEENNYFSSTSLRRTHSRRFAPAKSLYAKPPSKPKFNPGYDGLISPSNSPQFSNPWSPRTLHADSTAPSLSSTFANSLSLYNCNNEDGDQILFPSYDVVGYYEQPQVLEPPASPGDTSESYTVSPTSNSTSTNISWADSPEPDEYAEDESAVRTQPSRHVDYLSHNWKEEDIWSSWKHIVSRRGAYNNSARLENASWRTWMKAMNKLKTVSPETLNWLKDYDVTWLYGPLQTGYDTSLMLPSTSPCDSSSRLSKSNSFPQKKPILKKRSMSEIMLQRSLSACSLLKQAAAAVQAQQSERRSDHVAFPFSSSRRSRENTSALPSISSSGLASPSTGEKHIHFNEQVEQCIALEMKGDDNEEADPYAINDYYDSSSDDGVIMRKWTYSKRRFPISSKNTTPRNSFSTNTQTIAMLPSTTLKYGADTTEPQETVMKHSNGFWDSGKLSPSPSQETLRPSKLSLRILLSDEDEDDDVDMDW